MIQRFNVYQTKPQSSLVKNDKLAMKMQMDKKIVQIYTSLETNKAVRFEELDIKLQ